MTPPPQHEIDLVLAEINDLSHEEMARLIKHAQPGHAYFDPRLPYADVFWKRFRLLEGGDKRQWKD